MGYTNIILKEKIKNLGAEADVVRVRAGYARNFLLPQGKAYEATDANLRHVEALKAARLAREAEELVEAEKIATKLRRLTLKLTLETGIKGKAFGAITSVHLARALKEQADVELDRHDIHLGEAIKTVGAREVPVKLHPQLTVDLKVEVSAPTKGDA